jgi:hypothetical protein
MSFPIEALAVELADKFKDLGTAGVASFLAEHSSLRASAIVARALLVLQGDGDGALAAELANLLYRESVVPEPVASKVTRPIRVRRARLGQHHVTLAGIIECNRYALDMIDTNTVGALVVRLANIASSLRELHEMRPAGGDIAASLDEDKARLERIARRLCKLLGGKFRPMVDSTVGPQIYLPGEETSGRGTGWAL